MRSAAIFSLIFLTVLLSGCNKGKTNAGLEFSYLKKGDGKIVAPGQFLLIDLEIRDEVDSVWLDTRISGEPYLLRVDKENEKFPEQGESGVYRLLSKGDSVAFTVDVATIYEKTWMQPVPKAMDRNRKVNYNLIVREVMDEPRLKAYQQARMEESERIRMNRAIEQFNRDTTEIAQFLSQNKITTRKTDGGIRYVVHRDGKGPVPQRGEKAMVRYKGYTLDGKIFDSNLDAREALEVEVGKGKVISGWDDMLRVMPKGSKYTVYLPSLFGYGDVGFQPDIKPNAILVFEMELVEIRK